MKGKKFIPLAAFITGIYDEMIKAALNAKGLQAEYLEKMASHNAPLPVSEMVEPLGIDSFTITLHFRQVQPENHFLSGILPSLFPKYPPGTYLEITTKEKSQIPFTVTFNKDAGASNPTVNPPADGEPGYYVLMED